MVEDEGHHGYEIAKLIEQRSDGDLRFTLASLYATLYRMEDRGWIKGRWVEKAGQRRRCYYRITEAAERSSPNNATTGGGSWRRWRRWRACVTPNTSAAAEAPARYKRRC